MTRQISQCIACKRPGRTVEQIVRAGHELWVCVDSADCIRYFTPRGTS